LQGCGLRRKFGSHTTCFQECKEVWRNELSHSQGSLHFGSLSPGGLLNIQKMIARGQNSMDWRVPYIIKKFMEFRCLKWVRMTHLDIWNTSYGQKKGRESNWQFDSWSLKLKNRLDFLAFRWRATYCWKDLDEGYNFSLDLISIEGLHEKLWGPKIVGLPLGSLGTKCH